jgi:putative molybdopterin biosynthesis protein
MTIPGDPHDTGPLLTRDEAARFLNVSDQTVYRILRRGELRGYRVGHLIRISQTDLENYLKAPPPTEQEED